jgi:acyl carrier protein
MNKEEFIENCRIALDAKPGFLDEKSSPDNVENWDSMAWMSLIAMIAEKLGVVLSNEDLEDFRELGDLIAILEEKGLIE